MKADKMFNEVGYVKELGGSCYGDRYIDNNFTVSFPKYGYKVCLNCLCGYNHREAEQQLMLSAKEVEAIYTKMKELGWIE